MRVFAEVSQKREEKNKRGGRNSDQDICNLYSSLSRCYYYSGRDLGSTEYIESETEIEKCTKVFYRRRYVENIRIG